MNDSKILEELDGLGFFTISEIKANYLGISGVMNDDYTYLVRWFFDLECEEKLYRIRHSNEDYYITPNDFSKLMREHKLQQLLGFEPNS